MEHIWDEWKWTEIAKYPKHANISGGIISRKSLILEGYAQESTVLLQFETHCTKYICNLMEAEEEMRKETLECL